MTLDAVHDLPATRAARTADLVQRTALKANGDLEAWRRAARSAFNQDEVHALLDAALCRFPDAASLQADLAGHAQATSNWEAAERYWQAYAPSDKTGWTARVGIARALCKRGEVARGIQSLVEIHGEHGGDGDCLAALSRCAFEHATSLPDPWLSQLEKQLQHAVLHEKAAYDEMTLRALWVAYAAAAKREEKFDEYRTRLEQGTRSCPHCPLIKALLADARELAPRAGDLDADADCQFESLGGGGRRGGCEFGLFQRDCGQEPLGLLRWASIEPEQLASLLEQRFEAMGNEETIQIRPRGTYDWGYTELTYEIRGDHTHLNQATVTPAAARTTIARQMKFLARKLVDDLETGEKIFVYLMAEKTLSSDQIQRLFKALSAYGPCRVVFVTEVVTTTPMFEVQKVNRSCIVIVRSVPEGGEWVRNTTAIRESWQRICRTAATFFNPGVRELNPSLLSVQTDHKSIVYFDQASGRLLHGDPSLVPRNVFIVANGQNGHLLYLGENGDISCVRLVPAETVKYDLQSIVTFTTNSVFRMVETMGQAKAGFGLRQDDLFLCAELDGRITLSRQRIGPWEAFSLLDAASGSL